MGKRSKKIGICGNFGPKGFLVNGQIIKTKIVTEEIISRFGKKNVKKVNTWRAEKRPARMLIGCLGLFFGCKNIIILPARKGIKVIVPLFSVLGRILNKNIHYVVVGGWLPAFLTDRRKLINHITRFAGIYVQTKSMTELLEKQGIHNSVYMPNCKRMEPITSDELVIEFSEPYKVCTFSRVIAEKGIPEAVEAVERVNATLSRKCYRLDIYGDIESQFVDEFRNIISKSSDCIRHLGSVNFNESKSVLKEYFALLFPTYYDGEGFPGTFIDAFSAGLPVISSDWMYNNEIVRDGETGLIYKLEDNKTDGLYEVLLLIAEKPNVIMEMRKGCLLEAEKYKPEKALGVLLDKLGKQGD